MRNIYIKFWPESVKGKKIDRVGCRWKDNLKIGFKEIGYEDVDWIQVAQDRLL
jgi:hypothetical protein